MALVFSSNRTTRITRPGSISMPYCVVIPSRCQQPSLFLHRPPGKHHQHVGNSRIADITGLPSPLPCNRHNPKPFGEEPERTAIPADRIPVERTGKNYFSHSQLSERMIFQPPLQKNVKEEATASPHCLSRTNGSPCCTIRRTHADAKETTQENHPAF